MVQFTFPKFKYYTDEKPGPDGDSWYYEVQGDFAQYVALHRVMEKFGYDTEEFVKIMRKKVADGEIERSQYHGQYDDGDSYKNLVDDIDEKLPDLEYELYPQQKQGVAFLYGRNSAILGDETGVGKTIQLITAAALRMKQEHKPTLIITLLSTVNQWVETIKIVCGSDESQNISTDGLNPKKWTVLYYENFSKGKQLPNIIEACKNAKFGIAIFDELHKLKREKSRRSQNIAAVTDDVPTIWGASATVSANKAMDVKNQLDVIGHHLGKIDEGKFKVKFAGATPTGYKGSYKVDLGSRESIEGGERLNKWLNLSGVYVRRMKSDLRDMPNLSRHDQDKVHLNQEELDSRVDQTVSRFKDPSLAISKLLATRQVLAEMKVNSTVNKVIKIIEENKDKQANNYAASKVVVFTNFIEAANMLLSRITAAVRNIDPNYKVIDYLSLTRKKARQRVKELFTSDPNIKVLVMSMKMGGTGIDFPNAAQNMIVNDFDWTPESAEQSEGRIYRINTNHPVQIHYTLADGIDSDIYEIVKTKRKLAETIQKYRQEFHTKEYDPETLRKIVDAQHQLEELDNQLTKTRTQVTGVEDFKEYINSYEDIIIS